MKVQGKKTKRFHVKLLHLRLHKKKQQEQQQQTDLLAD